MTKYKTNSQQFNWTLTCPTCHQHIPVVSLQKQWQRDESKRRMTSTCPNCGILLEVKVLVEPNFGIRAKRDSHGRVQRILKFKEDSIEDKKV